MYTLTLLAAFVALASAAKVPAPAVVEASAAPKVRNLRTRLAKVLEHASALPAAVAAEARHVDDDAAHALSGKGAADQLGLEKVLAEFAAFSAHLSGRSDQLKQEAATSHMNLPAGALEKAQKIVPGLEAKIRKVVEHLKADKGPQSAAHGAVIATMDHALLAVAGQNAFERAVLLHNSLKAAHDFLETRTKDLAADRARLNVEIEEQQAFILFMMLKQRRKLPLKAQMALLKRHQFKDCGYAQRLLKTHTKAPMADQLLAILPAPLAKKLRAKDTQGPAGQLAAAGSNGRVQVVSSRMKNVVQNMAAGLAKAKVQLATIADGKSVSAEEKKQAKDIMTGLDSVLKKVSSTNDLKSQMEAMDDMQNKLKTWMMNAAKHQ